MKDYEGEEVVVGGWMRELDGVKDRNAGRGERRKRVRQLENEPGREEDRKSKDH